MDNLKIYIDRLGDGQTHTIAETLPPEFMEIRDDELSYKDPIRLKGEAYVTDEHLIIQLNIETTALVPCSICNDLISVPVKIKNMCLTEPLEEIKTAIFDLTESIRETILLQTPLFNECNGGNCPEREFIKKFMKPEEKPTDPADIIHFPFADLEK
jgi:uncharacterized metal-binding protein YceD (DUF177 family)